MKYTLESDHVLFACRRDMILTPKYYYLSMNANESILFTRINNFFLNFPFKFFLFYLRLYDKNPMLIHTLSHKSALTNELIIYINKTSYNLIMMKNLIHKNYLSSTPNFSLISSLILNCNKSISSFFNVLSKLL